MKHLDSFLQHSDPSKSSFCKALRCTKVEAKVLQKVIALYLDGEQHLQVGYLLGKLSNKPISDSLGLIATIKALIRSGWLAFHDSNATVQKLSTFEMLYESIMPSEVLLKVLEGKPLFPTLPKPQVYKNEFSYLLDRFNYIALRYQLATLHEHAQLQSIVYHELKKALKCYTRYIKARQKLSKQRFAVDRFIKKAALSKKEQLLFWALLKEEYEKGASVSTPSERLLWMISKDEQAYLRHRALLEEGSTLIDSGIVEYETSKDISGRWQRYCYLSEEVAVKLLHHNKHRGKKKIALRTLLKEQEFFEQLHPKGDLDDVVLHPKTKEVLDALVKQLDKKVHKRLKKWGIKQKRKSIDAKIIFYGAPGTGKTLSAMNFAKTLGRPILSLDCSKILSMYVGESEKNVRKIFDEFAYIKEQSKKEPILLLNEADQFLGARSSATGSADKMHNQMQAIFLEQIERFEGILIATTNLLENIDKAFSRRFGYKIEFKKPDFKQRIRLWQLMLPKRADYEEYFDIETLAKYPLTGGQIEVVIKNSAYKVAVRDESIFTMQDFIEEIEKELKGSFDSTHTIGFVRG